MAPAIPAAPPRPRRPYALYSIAGVFIAIVAVLIVLQHERALILSDVRAYVGGEGLYSKAQKRAVIQLLLYARNGAEAHWLGFEKALAVPIGDRDARLELLRGEPDIQRAAEAFVRGQNHPAEAERMARFFLRFQKVTYVAEAIRVWTEGDQEVARLQALGGELRRLVGGNKAGGKTNPVPAAALEGLIAQIAAADERLTLLEDQFSSTLSEGARFILSVTENLLLALAAVLLGVGWIYSIRVTGDVRRATAALRASEARYRVLSESMLEGLIILREGRFLHANPAALQLLGVSLEELVGTEFAPLIHPDYRGFVAERHSRRMAGDEPPPRYDIRILTRAGQAIWVHLANERVEWDGGPAVLTIMSDISERKRAEATLQESEERFRGLTEAFASYFWETGPDWRFTLVQGRGLRELGLSAEEMVGREAIDVTSRWELLSPSRAEFVALRERREPYRDILVGIRLQDGSYRYLSIWGQPRIAEDGRFLGYRGVTQDVTDRVMLQQEVAALNENLERRVSERTAQLERSNRELEAFNYSVSHDLRAPVGVISSFATVIRTDFARELPEQAKLYLAHIEHNAAQMTRLIDNLLEFSRMGRAVVARAPVNMRPLVDDIVRQLRQSDAHVLPVIGELPPAAGDADLLRQVWQNLVGNAVKFSRKVAVPAIEVGYAESGEGAAEEAAASFAYFVRDNGTGFDMRYADKLFGVFERLHSPSEFEGTGIGLAIAKRVIDLHGGRIWAQSAPGQGATFWFTLPG
jgi:PAS domain S-box-containing protein